MKKISGRAGIIIFLIFISECLSLHSQSMTNKAPDADKSGNEGKLEREFFISTLTRVADPVRSIKKAGCR